MVHQMHLHHHPFCLIQNGYKTIEMRLNDEKRQLIHVGDTIEFSDRDTEEMIQAKVVQLHHFSSFQELYQKLDKKELGYLEEEKANPKDMEKYYPLDEQEKYGVVGIEFQLVKEK